MVVTFYETARGDRPVEEYLDELPAKEAAKVLDTLPANEVHGLAAAVSRQIRGKLWEIKVSATRILHRGRRLAPTISGAVVQVEEGLRAPADRDRQDRRSVIS
jgi:hypothetical protein